MEYTYTSLLQEVSEYLTSPAYNDQYTKAMDGLGLEAEEAQNTCRTAIQNYLSKLRKLPLVLRNEKTVDNLYNDIIAWGPITPLILTGANEGISEIRVYGPYDVAIQQHGQWKRLDKMAFHTEVDLQNIINRILASSDINMNDMNGFTDRARLPNGSRVTIVEQPNTGASYYMSIRIYNKEMFSSRQLVSNGSISERQDKLLKFLMNAKANNFWFGPMTSGKTTALSAYLPHLPKSWHVLTIEDSPEFLLKQRNPDLIVSEFYTHEGEFALTWSKASSLILRTAADVIYWGELRDSMSTFRAVDNMTTGHRGSGSTGHAGNAEEGIQNLANRYQEAVPSLDTGIVLQRVSNAIDFIPIMRRSRSGRRYMGDISAITWDYVKKEPLIFPIIKRRINKDDSFEEDYQGIPEFLKNKLLAWNSVFEEDFEEWSL